MIQARTLASLRLSAASGLVVADDGLWVVADDLALLHRYDLIGGFLERLFLDAAASDQPLPKADKPDLEALAQLPDGVLLALGSGSRPQRRLGYRVDAARRVSPIDLSPLYLALEGRLPALNIEGAVVRGNSLLLAHRGSGDAASALVELDLEAVMADLPGGRLGATGLRAVRPFDPGRLDGVRLALSDLAVHPDGTLWYSAAAERTDDPYQDGVVSGSVIGWLDAQGGIGWQDAVLPVCKIEGLHWNPERNSWLAVADADDPQRLAPLLELHAPR